MYYLKDTIDAFAAGERAWRARDYAFPTDAATYIVTSAAASYATAATSAAKASARQNLSLSLTLPHLLSSQKSRPRKSSSLVRSLSAARYYHVSLWNRLSKRRGVRI